MSQIVSFREKVYWNILDSANVKEILHFIFFFPLTSAFCDFESRILLCCRPLYFGCLDDLTKFYQHKVVVREISMMNNFQMYKMVKGRWNRSPVYQNIGVKKYIWKENQEDLAVLHKVLEKVLDHRIIRNLLLFSFLIITLHSLLLSLRLPLCQMTFI